MWTSLLNQFTRADNEISFYNNLILLLFESVTISIYSINVYI